MIPPKMGLLRPVNNSCEETSSKFQTLDRSFGDDSYFLMFPCLFLSPCRHKWQERKWRRERWPGITLTDLEVKVGQRRRRSRVRSEVE